MALFKALSLFPMGLFARPNAAFLTMALARRARPCRRRALVPAVARIPGCPVLSLHSDVVIRQSAPTYQLRNGTVPRSQEAP